MMPGSQPRLAGRAGSPVRSGRARRRAGLWMCLGTCLWAACGPPPTPRLAPGPAGKSAVRVGLAVRVSDLVLVPQGAWMVRCGGTRWQPPAGVPLRFIVLGERVVLTSDRGEEHSDAEQIVLEPVDSTATVSYAGTPYAGTLQVRRADPGLTLVDRLDIETYLMGVVPWEIGWKNGPGVQAAVEAQAIAARTYACARLGQFDALGFDVYADERDQVFRGLLRQDPVANRAIATTRGLVLDHDGALIQAYYCSTCGGFTSWVDHVWSKPAQSYLCGRRDAPASGVSFCAGSPHFRWTEAWSGAELESILNETLPRVLQLPPQTRIGALVDLRAGDRDDSGRVLDLIVQTTSGTYHVRGDSIRWVLKPRDRPLLRSILFKLDVRREHGAIVLVTVRGAGNGHGVGMCQVGALEMARQGFDRSAILGHYYEGATLHRAY